MTWNKDLISYLNTNIPHNLVQPGSSCRSLGIRSTNKPQGLFLTTSVLGTQIVGNTNHKDPFREYFILGTQAAKITEA